MEATLSGSMEEWTVASASASPERMEGWMDGGVDGRVGGTQAMLETSYSYRRLKAH